MTDTCEMEADLEVARQNYDAAIFSGSIQKGELSIDAALIVEMALDAYEEQISPAYRAFLAEPVNKAWFVNHIKRRVLQDIHTRREQEIQGFHDWCCEWRRLQMKYQLTRHERGFTSKPIGIVAPLMCWLNRALSTVHPYFAGRRHAEKMQLFFEGVSFRTTEALLLQTKPEA